MMHQSQTAIRILLVDDHQIFLTGLRLLIEKEPDMIVVGTASNRAEALALMQEHPDIVLLDLDLGNESGIDFLPQLIKPEEPPRVIIVTGVPDPELHLRAVRLGALGVVLKLDPPGFLVKAIRKVHGGEMWLNRPMISTVMTELIHARAKKMDSEALKIAELTVREREVIALVAEGMRNKQIGERLFISEKTVRHYLTSVFDKLGVADRLALMIYAFQHGLAKIPTADPQVERTKTVLRTS
ncbi:MAG: DNA-binding response regulator [Acidobacteria bacterium]|nr:MAG: DNA-binding response regulator [Acidobacteriota bacterium]